VRLCGAGKSIIL